MAGDYREKIRKLLALAESPNEHEAEAALIKAHQLMAEHGLSVRDLREYNSQTVKKILTNIGYTKRRDPWIVLLSGILATNYCCKAYVSREKYKETKYIGFIGLEEDLNICIIVFKYAVDCITAGVKRVKRENKSYPVRERREFMNGYAYGYVHGIKNVLNRQAEKAAETESSSKLNQSEESEQKDNIGQSTELSGAARNKRNQPAVYDVFVDRENYLRGYKDGCKFDPDRRLAAADRNIILQEKLK